MNAARRVEFRPFPGDLADVRAMGHLPVDHVDVETFECLLCGECKEIELAATEAPADVCLDCLDEIAETARREESA